MARNIEGREPQAENKEGEPRKMNLQEIYDLREMTGFISGNDLHDFFAI